MIVITPQSHLDHGIDIRTVRFILERFQHVQGFTLETVELPNDHTSLAFALRGPSAGTAPVPDDEVILRMRPGRAWPSRMMRMDYEILRKPGHVTWAPLYTRQLTVIAGPARLGANVMALYTCYAGPAAPREPGDPSMQGDLAAMRESEAFWKDHALVM
jgi:hypothetical protein